MGKRSYRQIHFKISMIKVHHTISKMEQKTWGFPTLFSRQLAWKFTLLAAKTCEHRKHGKLFIYLMKKLHV